MSDTQRPGDAIASPSRRGFFKRAALGAGALTLAGTMSACDSSGPDDAEVVLDFSNDFGVLNYAYALEQLEYAFYLQVSQGAYFRGLAQNSAERQILDDLRKHELVHVDFLKAALGTNAIGDLSVNFSAINFSDRTSVLTAARAFEDTGVSAYNGAGQYLRDAGLLTIAGKIVSVEARHASAIRDLIQPGTIAFAGDDVVTPSNGLDVAASPSAVLQVIAPFVTTRVALRNVPT